MIRLVLRGLRARRRRLAGLLAAIALGVAFLAGTLSLGATMSAAITTSFTTANRGVDVIVRSATQTSPGQAATARGPISAALVDRVRSVPGVAAAEGQVMGTASIAGADGTLIAGMGPKAAGAWLGDARLNAWHLVAGQAPRGDHQVVIDQASADKGKLRVGSRTTIYAPGPVGVTVTGIADYGNAKSNGGSTYVAFAPGAAQRYLLGNSHEVTQVLARAQPGVPASRLAAAVRAVVRSPDVQVVTGQLATDEQINAVNDGFLRYFQAFLDVFGAIALLVAGLSIHNTFGVVAAQQARESALLRALGAVRGQVLRVQLAEAALLGLAGAVAGVAGGYAMAAGLKGVFAGFGLALPASGVVFTAGNALLAGGVGVAVTLLAALTPAVRASRTTPLVVLRATAAEPAGQHQGARVAAGLLLAAAGAAGTVAAALAGSGIGPAGAAVIVTLAGVLLLGPVLARVAAGLAGGVLARLRGVPGRLAQRNAARAPRRTAAAATALTVGVAIVTLFTIFATSLGEAARANVAQTFTGDLVVTAGSSGPAPADQFSPAVAARVAALPGVAAAVPAGRGQVLLDGDPAKVTVADPAALQAVFALRAPADRLAVSRSTADDHGWRVGSRATVTFADGMRVTFTIGAIYGEIDPLGAVVLPAKAWIAHDSQTTATAVYIKGVPASRGALERIAAEYGRLTVRDRAQFIADSAAGASVFANIVYVLLALAIGIALLGIGNTLALAIHERTRELGLLRAVGATRRQVRTALRWEAALTALLGTLLGTGFGLLAGWALTRALGTGTGNAVTVPWLQLAVVLLAGIIAGLLAGTRPARRAARLDPLTAIAAQ
jgi:putative ABC transport system permease protein